MFDAVPGKLRKVDQAVGAAQVHERAEGRDAGDDALEHVALVERREQAVLLALAPVAHGSRSERISRLRWRSSSTTLSCIFWPTSVAHRCVGVALCVCWPASGAESCEAGTKPRTRPTRTITPPRL